MKASEKLLLRFIEGNDKNFIIPVYQRNYDWGKKECKKLFNDLKLIAKNKLKNYFLGSIVSIDIERDKFFIIDGQQRLTTISLLLLAMYDLVDSKQKEATKFIKERIKDEYLINKYSDDKTKKIRLKQTKKDADNFYFLVNDDIDKVDRNSGIFVNYEFFKDELKKENLDEIYNSIGELMIVDIELKKEVDDPQLIFESLNSTGLALTEADKIRNFILMNETEEKQEQYYETYWKKIEENVAFKTDKFIRDFLTYKTRNIPNIREVYFNFKNYDSNKDTDKEGLLKELLRFSKYYRFILHPAEFPDKKISELLKEIQTLEVSVFNPALLELLKDHDKNRPKDDDDDVVIDDTQLKEILQTVIDYVFRRSICDVPTNALNNIFASLISDVKKEKDFSNEQYAEILKHILIKKGSSRRFPKDNEVKESLLIKNVFRMKNKQYFLTKLENHKNKEPVDIENLIEKKKIQIEHIMPQTLTAKWKKDLGEDWETIYSQYLHTLGNLTLTGYNPELSNKSFQDKKKWFEDSRFYFNKYLTRIEKFTEKELKERTKHLTERFLEIWKYPQTSYVSDHETEQNDFYTLEDIEEIDFTGKNIVSLSVYGGKEIEVNKWNDFYVKAIKFLLEFDRGYLEKIRELGIEIGSKEKVGRGRRRPEEVIDGIYINVNFVSNRMLKHLGQIVDAIGFGRSDIKFQIEKGSDKKIKVSNKKTK
ncbi:hypothetical protein COTS27_00125 [Spirochaetota bacterium]|nr:hypothetical protein COTS27_00125 [Spirochaetota bacterium]